VGQYRHDTKYGPVDIVTNSIDDGWVAYVSPAQLDVELPPDDGPVPLLEDEAVERLLQRIERSRPSASPEDTPAPRPERGHRP
jgi:hypothetical protein